MPRRTPSPWVVFETPPGSSRKSCSPPSGSSGMGMAFMRSSNSATGVGPSTFCPVGIRLPSAMAFFIRKSTGSIRRASATLSICDSWAKQVCTAPKPRIAPQGGLSV